MTVRMPQAESGSITQSTGPYAALHSDPPAGTALEADHHLVVPEAGSGQDPVVPPVSALPARQPQVDGRRAHRIARHQRRRISIGCAVLVAVCLVITILIVGMARNRTPGAQVVVPALALAIPPVDSRPVVPTVPPNQFRDATASEGGHR
jgi:hypothetical protein